MNGSRCWMVVLLGISLTTSYAQSPSLYPKQLLDSARVYWFYNYNKTEAFLKGIHPRVYPLKTPEDVGLVYEINSTLLWTNYFYSHLARSHQFLDSNLQLIAKYKTLMGQELYNRYNYENKLALAGWYTTQEDYNNALAIYYDCLEELHGRPITDQVYQYLATNHALIASIRLAKGEYEASIGELKSFIDYNQRRKAKPNYGICRNLGLAYLAKKDYPQAKKYLFEAIHILQTDVPRTNYNLYGQGIIYTYEALASYYRAIGKNDSSLISFKLAEAGLKHNSPFTARVYLGFGQAYAAAGNTALAQHYLQQAEAVNLRVDGPKNMDLAKARLALGDFYYGHGAYTDALNSYQRAVTCLITNFDDADPHANPALRNIHSKRYLFNALHKKTTALWGLYLQRNDTSVLHLARKTNLLSITLLDSIANEFSLNADKAILAEQSFPAYEQGIRISSALYHITNDQRYVDDCFILADKSKGVVLLENLRLANNYAGVDPTLLTQEKSIRAEMTHCEGILYKEKKNNDSELLTATRDQYSSAKHAYEQWLEKIKMEAPKYYKLRFDHSVITTKAIQQELLKPGEALVEYFVGDSTLTIIGFTKEHRYVEHKKFIGDLSAQVSRIRSYLTSAEEDERRNFEQTARELYSVLLGDCLLALGKDITSLVIVPDGILGHLPFEVLLTSNTEIPSYAGLEVSIRYAHSASYLREQEQKQSSGAKHFFAGYLAEGGSESNQVRAASGILKGAQQEVESIATLVGSESSIFRPATKKDFQDHGGEYQIIHLAMHSVVNNENPMLSTLYFTAAPGDTTESSHLTANDLYNMQLHADMAVLSACNTGVGKINRGEGIMSFARAFSFAGVNSAIISLWQVPDKATARLMVSFYQHLKEGKTKDVALQLAKKSFVRNYPQMAHPYYWSGFILTGNNDVVSFPTDTRWWWMGGALFLLLAVAMWMIRKRFSLIASDVNPESSVRNG